MKRTLLFLFTASLTINAVYAQQHRRSYKHAPKLAFLNAKTTAPTTLTGLTATNKLATSPKALIDSVKFKEPVVKLAPGYVLPIDKSAVKGSYSIGVSDHKTTHIIFPAKIRDIDAGSSDIIALIPESVNNILRVKAANPRPFGETNITVLTDDGGFYSFLIRYESEPSVLNINIANNTRSDNAVSSALGINKATAVSLVGPVADVNKTELLHTAARVYDHKPFARNVGVTKQRMSLLLGGLYVQGATLYVQCKIDNDSEIDYTLDFAKFYIRDKDVLKRMASQEMELPVQASYPETLTKFRGRTDYTMVYAIPLKTFTEDKVVEMELYEKEGGRHLRFQIDSDIMLKARGL
ncbi:conjugative transposon protein TraN [uncultured Fibrella sp.]|uniref:conjugative transposon protein TraN n=1 Tax=uncultured Fibrella sp. TaxID=1284596 RepID=UPI0035C94AD7